MSADLVKLLLSALTVLGSIFGLVRYLLNMYFKKEEELTKTKADLWQISLADLKETVSDHKRMIESLNGRIDDIKKDMGLHRKAIETDLAARQSFVNAIEKRFQAIEQEFGKVIKRG